MAELRVREVHRAILRDDPVASPLVGRHLCHQAQLAARVNSGYREPRVLGGAHIQHVSKWRVIEIIDTVAGVYRGQLLPVMTCIQDLRPRTASNQKVSCVWIDRETVRTVPPHTRIATSREFGVF